jgi:hypothetical protein
MSSRETQNAAHRTPKFGIFMDTKQLRDYSENLNGEQEDISTNIMFLDIIHRPVYISKHNVSETGVCLRFQVKPTQLGRIDRASPYLRK